MVEIATKAMMNAAFPKTDSFHLHKMKYVACKAPMFSFARLPGADPALRVEMASTGEVACFGTNQYEAFLKAMMASGFRLPKRNIFVSVAPRDRFKMVEPSKIMLDRGCKLFGTPGTAAFLNAMKISCESIAFNDHSSVSNALKAGSFDLIVNSQSHLSSNDEVIVHDNNVFPFQTLIVVSQIITTGYEVRRAAINLQIPLITNMELYRMLATSLAKVIFFSYQDTDLTFNSAILSYRILGRSIPKL